MVSYNTINGGSDSTGLYLYYELDTTLLDNQISNTYIGIESDYSTNINMTGNTITNASNTAMYLYYDEADTVIDNILSTMLGINGSTYAAYLYGTQDSEILHNTLTANTWVVDDYNVDSSTSVAKPSISIRTTLYSILSARTSVDDGSNGNTYNDSTSGNSYYFVNGTPAWQVYNITDTNGDGWADVGSDLPFSQDVLGDALWSGSGEDYHPAVAAPVPPSTATPERKSWLSVSADSTCNGTTVTVTSGDSHIAGAAVDVDGNRIGTTGDSGTVAFPGCGSSVQVHADKEGYLPADQTVQLVSCGQCAAPQCTSDSQCPDTDMCQNQTCVPVSCSCGSVASHSCQNYECCSDNDCSNGQVCTDHSCKQKQQQCTPPTCCTADSQCGDTQNCLTATGGPASAGVTGKCSDITGCGSIANHVLTPYQCGSAVGCPTCEQGSVCTNNVCVQHDLKGPQTGFVGDNANVQATEGDTSCVNCQLLITDPAGKNLTGSTDSKGGYVLPLTLQGNYTVTLLKDGVVVKTIRIESLPKAAPSETQPPTAQGSPEILSLVGLLVLLVIVVIVIVYWRSMPKGGKK